MPAIPTTWDPETCAYDSALRSLAPRILLA